jgi:hypothetical protein
MGKLKDWERKGKMVAIPINKKEVRKAIVVGAVNGWGLRWQIAQWVREGLERDMPAGKGLVVK